MIKFYYNLAPNPTKVALFLEESGLPYELMPIDTRKGEQHTPAYRAISIFSAIIRVHQGVIIGIMQKILMARQ